VAAFTADNDSHGIAGALESQMLLVPVLCNSLAICAGKRRPMKVLLIAMAVFAVSGASAGLLGIGGALIFNPYLLQLGMDPRVSPQPPLCLFHVLLSGRLQRENLAQICVWSHNLS
jgi:hypothetical protein